VTQSGPDEFSARIAQAYAATGPAVALGRGVLGGSVVRVSELISACRSWS
jgi:hypothetical protein